MRNRIPAASIALSLLFAACALIPPAHANPADPYLKVTVEGTADLTGSQGRVKAIQAAERQALAIAVTALLDERYLDLAASLQHQPDRYVQTARLLSSEVANGATRAVVEVYLRNHELRSDVAGAVFTRLRPRPRVIVLVAEEIAGESFLNANTPGATELALVEALRASGFNVVDPALIRQRYSAPDLLTRAQGGAAVASRFGLENEADLVIVGEARSYAESQAATGNLRRMVAETTLSLIRSLDAATVDTRTSRAAVQSMTAGEGARLALRDAATKVQQSLMVSAVLAMVDSAPSQHYTLTIESPGSREFLEGAQALIEAQPGVTALEVLRLSATEALLQFRYSGKMRPLVETLESYDHPTHLLAPTRIVGRTMVFQTLPREN